MCQDSSMGKLLFSDITDIIAMYVDNGNDNRFAGTGHNMWDENKDLGIPNTVTVKDTYKVIKH